MTKVPEHSRPHQDETSWAHTVEQTTVQNSTIYPIIRYDEGLGVISAYESNPQNAAFLEYNGSSCYPTSTIHKIFCEGQFNLSKEFLETDKGHILRFATMKIYTSFMDGQLAEDELSGLDLNEILELQNESTDRQTMALYNAVNMRSYKAGGLNLGADEAGLTTDVKIEAVAFNENQYYDCLHYLTNGKKLVTIQSGLRWHTLTRNNPHKTIRFTQEPSTKYMNPYTFLGVLIHVPLNNSTYQFGKAGDTTVDTNALEVVFRTRYNEFNHEFNHSLQ